MGFLEHCFSTCGSQPKLLWFTIMYIITQSKISVFYNYKPFFCFILVCLYMACIQHCCSYFSSWSFGVFCCILQKQTVQVIINLRSLWDRAIWNCWHMPLCMIILSVTAQCGWLWCLFHFKQHKKLIFTVLINTSDTVIRPLY